MKKNLIVKILLVTVFILTSCTSHKKIEPDDEFAVESGNSQQSAGSSPDGDLSLDGLDDTAGDKSAQAPVENNEDLSLEKELNSLEGEGNAQAPPSATESELNLDEATKTDTAAATESAPVNPSTEAPAPVEVAPADAAPAPETAQEPVVADAAPAPSEPSKPATIDNVTYQGNSNGGTVSISADQPLKYTTRLNSTTNQFIVEVENSTIPSKLKRSLNTKDMASSIGSVDIYQKSGSSVARFVVQLRAGSTEPLVQLEGNTLLIIGASSSASNNAGTSDSTVAASAQDLQSSSIDGQSLGQVNGSEVVDLNSAGIMSSDNLEEFLISNNKFYGKKISIETNKMDIKEALKFIAEESAVNMIIDEAVDGKVSLKLKSVPWDQALILLLKTKKLGFKRQGTVLRIGKIEDFQEDEAQAVAMKEARKAKAPLIIKRFFIGYANIEELEKKISEYLTTIEVEKAVTSTTEGQEAGKAKNSSTTQSAKVKEKIGKVIGDKRTNSLIVQDTEENMKRIEQLVTALDTQPQQVLIEGKVVEAKESFSKGLGVNWNSLPVVASSVNRARIGINPALDAGVVVFDSTFQWGELDILGSLSARLQLGEREDKVRVLSSPRVAVLSSETANISQTVGLLVPSSTSSGTGTGTTTTTNQIVPVGVSLSVTPIVSNEGTVTLDMDITRSFLATVDGTTTEDRKAKTKVIVRSGQTAVVGGIFESENRTADSGVPGFKDLPILGRLFRSDRDSKSKNELVIFVTPTILKPVTTGEKRSNEM